ncbi:hypothetical protein QN397_23615 [Variovorax sp. RTB1]|uniref:hypothetical protein n=1 Tax=Variovorax sp. RTB1 TaxID=3048631 RepID=UPI002B238BC6|nr:hypothetical protein [Variovorax sp. RTB1]MEB0114272.1 hypothetical protein [Variovorax sp. RTB1]
MQLSTQDRTHRTRQRPKAASFLLTAAFVLTASIAMPQISAAAEIKLSGSGTFKAPKAEQLAALPTDLGFSQSDLATGSWSFSVRYEDSTPGVDLDPCVGRYVGAIRSFRLVIGSTTLDLPIDQAAIVISDGGGGFPNRESIRVEAKALIPSGILHLSWVQVNQQLKGTDLRGPAGALPNDAMPPSTMVANMATANPSDRFLELRIDRPSGDPRPVLYLSSSKLTVTAGPATAP